jgi:hypothetical protein
MGDVIRTVKINRDVPDELHQTKEQFLHCANTTAAWAWSTLTSIRHLETTSRESERLRDETVLTANSVQKRIRRAIDVIKSGVTRLKNGETTSFSNCVSNAETETADEWLRLFAFAWTQLI